MVDKEGLLRQLERWERELRLGGFRGSTSGITEEGRLFALARFESEEAAQHNSDRAEQSAWCAETEKTLEDANFQKGVKVIAMRGGGSNDAGFVQVMRGRVLDAAKMDELWSRVGEFEATMASHRPDVIGDITVVHADGSYTDAVYFHIRDRGSPETKERSRRRKCRPCSRSG